MLIVFLGHRAPAPLYCGPKTSDQPFTGFWDYNYECEWPVCIRIADLSISPFAYVYVSGAGNKGWANPPETCSVYEGQKAGRFDHTSAYASTGGRTDVEGCCWWYVDFYFDEMRGIHGGIHVDLNSSSLLLTRKGSRRDPNDGRVVSAWPSRFAATTCFFHISFRHSCVAASNFGKLNYYLGKRAADEGRESRYPSVDFCKDPEVICASSEYKELKWVAGSELESDAEVIPHGPSAHLVVSR